MSLRQSHEIGTFVTIDLILTILDQELNQAKLQGDARVKRIEQTFKDLRKANPTLKEALNCLENCYIARSHADRALSLKNYILALKNALSSKNKESKIYLIHLVLNGMSDYINEIENLDTAEQQNLAKYIGLLTNASFKEKIQPLCQKLKITVESKSAEIKTEQPAALPEEIIALNYFQKQFPPGKFNLNVNKPETVFSNIVLFFVEVAKLNVNSRKAVIGKLGGVIFPALFQIASSAVFIESLFDIFSKSKDESENAFINFYRFTTLSFFCFRMAEDKKNDTATKHMLVLALRAAKKTADPILEKTLVASIVVPFVEQLTTHQFAVTLEELQKAANEPAENKLRAETVLKTPVASKQVVNTSELKDTIKPVAESAQQVVTTEPNKKAESKQQASTTKTTKQAETKRSTHSKLNAEKKASPVQEVKVELKKPLSLKIVNQLQDMLNRLNTGSGLTADVLDAMRSKINKIVKSKEYFDEGKVYSVYSKRDREAIAEMTKILDEMAVIEERFEQERYQDFLPPKKYLAQEMLEGFLKKLTETKLQYLSERIEIRAELNRILDDPNKDKFLTPHYLKMVEEIKAKLDAYKDFVLPKDEPKKAEEKKSEKVEVKTEEKKEVPSQSAAEEKKSEPAVAASSDAKQSETRKPEKLADQYLLEIWLKQLTDDVTTLNDRQTIRNHLQQILKDPNREAILTPEYKEIVEKIEFLLRAKKDNALPVRLQVKPQVQLTIEKIYGELKAGATDFARIRQQMNDIVLDPTLRAQFNLECERLTRIIYDMMEVRPLRMNESKVTVLPSASPERIRLDAIARILTREEELIQKSKQLFNDVRQLEAKLKEKKQSSEEDVVKLKQVENALQEIEDQRLTVTAINNITNNILEIRANSNVNLTDQDKNDIRSLLQRLEKINKADVQEWPCLVAQDNEKEKKSNVREAGSIYYQENYRKNLYPRVTAFIRMVINGKKLETLARITPEESNFSRVLFKARMVIRRMNGINLKQLDRLERTRILEERNLILMEIKSDATVDVHEMRRLSRQAGNKAILIKQGKQFFLYGFHREEGWTFTELDPSSFQHLAFPSIGKTNILKHDDDNSTLKMYVEIITKEAHFLLVDPELDHTTWLEEKNRMLNSTEDSKLLPKEMLLKLMKEMDVTRNRVELMRGLIRDLEGEIEYLLSLQQNGFKNMSQDDIQDCYEILMSANYDLGRIIGYDIQTYNKYALRYKVKGDGLEGGFIRLINAIHIIQACDNRDENNFISLFIAINYYIRKLSIDLTKIPQHYIDSLRENVKRLKREFPKVYRDHEYLLEKLPQAKSNVQTVPPELAKAKDDLRQEYIKNPKKLLEDFLATMKLLNPDQPGFDHQIVSARFWKDEHYRNDIREEVLAHTTFTKKQEKKSEAKKDVKKEVKKPFSWKKQFQTDLVTVAKGVAAGLFFRRTMTGAMWGGLASISVATVGTAMQAYSEFAERRDKKEDYQSFCQSLNAEEMTRDELKKDVCQFLKDINLPLSPKTENLSDILNNDVCFGARTDSRVACKMLKEKMQEFKQAGMDTLFLDAPELFYDEDQQSLDQMFIEGRMSPALATKLQKMDKKCFNQDAKYANENTYYDLIDAARNAGVRVVAVKAKSLANVVQTPEDDKIFTLYSAHQIVVRELTKKNTIKFCVMTNPSCAVELADLLGTRSMLVMDPRETAAECKDAPVVTLNATLQLENLMTNKPCPQRPDVTLVATLEHAVPSFVAQEPQLSLRSSSP